MHSTAETRQAAAEFRQAAQDAQLVALARAYPAWHVWVGDAGWHATRETALTLFEAGSGLTQTVDAATAEELTELICAQEKRLMEVARERIRSPSAL